MTILSDNTLAFKHFGETKTETESSISKSENGVSQIFNNKRHYQQYSRNNKYTTYKTQENLVIPGEWENTLAIMKLKQMILNNARNQILIQRRFNI